MSVAVVLYLGYYNNSRNQDVSSSIKSLKLQYSVSFCL